MNSSDYPGTSIEEFIVDTTVIESPVKNQTGNNNSQMTVFSSPSVLLSPALQQIEKTYITAGYARKIVDFTDNEAINSIMIILNTAYAELGQEPRGNSREERKNFMGNTVKLIIKDIKFYTPSLTMEDLRIAVEHGIRNMYGDYFGISAVTIHNFIDKYLKSDERLDAIQKQKRFAASNQEPKTLSQEQKDALRVDCLRSNYRCFKESGIVFDVMSLNYKFLQECGEIILTQEQMSDYQEKAIELVDNESLTGTMTIREMINRMRDTGDKTEAYKTKCHELILIDYYKKIQPERIEDVISNYLKRGNE